MNYLIYVVSLILLSAAIWRIKIWSRKQRIIALAAFYSLFLAYYASFAIGSWEKAKQRENEDTLYKELMAAQDSALDTAGNTSENRIFWIGEDLTYEKAEKENKLQEYYRYNDFSAAFAMDIRPKIEHLKIKSEIISNKDKLLNLKTSNGKTYQINLQTLKYENAVILFNGKDAPLIWDEYKTDGFEEAILNYFNVKNE